MAQYKPSCCTMRNIDRASGALMTLPLGREHHSLLILMIFFLTEPPHNQKM